MTPDETPTPASEPATDGVPVKPEEPEIVPDTAEKPSEETAQANVETAQVPVVEPLPAKTEPLPVPPPLPSLPPTPVASASDLLKQMLVTARSVFHSKKRKKLEKILAFLDQKKSIANDDVEKLLHTSDATATRYLNQLEKEGKIVKTKQKGRGVQYVRAF